MNKRNISVICAVLALTVLLSGCSFLGIGANKLSYSSASIAGQVESVSGKTITLTLGFISGDDDASGTTQDSEPSAQPQTDAATSSAPENTEKPAQTDAPDAAIAPPTVSASASEQPETTQSPEQSEPEATAEPENNGEDSAKTQAGAYFTLGTTTAQLKVNDASALYNEDGSAAKLTDIKSGAILSIDYNAKGGIDKITIRQVGRLVVSNGVSYYAANVFSADDTVSGGAYDSTKAGENTIILDNGAEVGFTGTAISRTSDSGSGSGQSAAYGVGAALLAADGTAYVEDSTVTVDAYGAAGLFAGGKGVVYAGDTTVDTSKDVSFALAASGGKLYAWDVMANTKGDNSPAVMCIGGSAAVIDGGEYNTEGADSPAVCGNSAITFNNASLTAKNSAAANVLGGSVTLFDSKLSGNMADNEQNGTTWTVGVYNSGSASGGDTASFHMVGGSIESKNGGIFYTTNTKSDILLSGVEITQSENSNYFLRCTGNANKAGWGAAGANGAECGFTAISQKIDGNIIWDSISKLDFYMQKGSTLTGAVKTDQTYSNKVGGGHCSMYISEDSKWIVTGDSVVTSLYSEGDIVDAKGKTVTIKNSEGKTVVKGSSEYTVTVQAYSSPADFTNAAKLPVWTELQVQRPSGLKK